MTPFFRQREYIIYNSGNIFVRIRLSNYQSSIKNYSTWKRDFMKVSHDLQLQSVSHWSTLTSSSALSHSLFWASASKARSLYVPTFSPAAQDTARARRGIVVITICSIDRTKLTWSENGRFPKIGSLCFKSLAELGRTGSVRPSIGLSVRSIIDTLKDDVTLVPQKDLYKKKIVVWKYPFNCREHFTWLHIPP